MGGFRWNSSTGQDDFLTITDCYTTQSYGAFAVLAMDDHFTLARNVREPREHRATHLPSAFPTTRAAS